MRKRHDGREVTNWCRRRGHSLLEVLIATAVFILVAVGTAGAWVLYGSALAKSGENLAANHLARGVTEGIISNGYEWLEAIDPNTFPIEEQFTVERIVRTRTANINFSILWDAVFNTPTTPGDRSTNRLIPFGDEGVCRITVAVRWNSDKGSKDIDGYNNGVQYTTYLAEDGTRLR